VHDLAVQSKLAEHLDDRGGVLAVGSQPYLSPSVGDPAHGERVIECCVHRRRKRGTCPVYFGHRSVFEYDSVELGCYVGELGLQFDPDPVGDQHDVYTALSDLLIASIAAADTCPWHVRVPSRSTATTWKNATTNTVKFLVMPIG
jgi:hypothetical protein